MIDRNTIIEQVLEHKVIAILRGFNQEQLYRIMDALYEGDIRMAEITFDQSGKTSEEQTAEYIGNLSKKFAGRMHIGAGTVMTARQVELAVGAGAEFIISPDTCREVIEKTVELGAVSMPGSFSPTEAANAKRWGADFVKLFPIAELGTAHLKNIAAPLSHIRFLAVGGVDAHNLTDYLRAGAVGVGVATSMVDRRAVEAGDFETVTKQARLYHDLAMSV